MKAGKLYGIGVGPGDPELVTLKALRILQSVPVVACPQDRTGGPGFASRIVGAHLKPEQQLLPLYLPFVTDPEQLIAAWQAAAERLYTEIATGTDVAFITEGDASLYSTFSYLLFAFQARYPHVPVEIVPGIASPLAAAAALQIPLVTGDQILTVLPALYRIEQLEQAWATSDTVVLLKVASVYPQVHSWLTQQKPAPAAALVEWVSGANQKLWSTLPAPEVKLPYFCLLILRHSS